MIRAILNLKLYDSCNFNYSKKTMQYAKEFTVFVQGATLQSDLTLNIPTLDYHIWFFKHNQAVLYFCSTLQHSRAFFQKTHRGHTVITQKGFTVQSSKCGPKAGNHIRKMLNEGGWQCSDLLELKRFKEGVKVQEETLRIKWKKHINGKMKPKPDSIEIRGDFNDRLHSGDDSDIALKKQQTGDPAD